jgi:hypothetical protein
MEEVGVFRAILSISRPKSRFYGQLVEFVVLWYIFTRYGMLYREKSGNPDFEIKNCQSFATNCFLHPTKPVTFTNWLIPHAGLCVGGIDKNKRL